MAEESKRERIVRYVIGEIETLENVKFVTRKQPSYNELKLFSNVQFPAVAVVAGLPVPDEKEPSRSSAGHDRIISNLDIKVFCYLQDRVNPDAMISNLLDDLFSKLYEDKTKGGLVLSTVLKPMETTEYWDPYGAFCLVVKMKYAHTTGGI
jgi:hypothetical protein